MVLALITLVFSASFADVYIKDLDGTNVEIVFTFKDDSATEMSLIGDFCGWVEPGTPMAKNADGKWEVTLKSTMDGVIKYKFWYKGTYIYDFKAPDKIDDGFGGNNGLIEVSKALAKQKAKELADSGDAAGAAALLASSGAGDSGLKFATWSMLGLQTKFDTVDTKNIKGVQTEDAGLDSVGIGLKSYWKVSGNAVPNMPVYLEVAAVENEGFENLYKEGTYKDGEKGDPALSFKDGARNFFTDLLFDPVYWLGGQKNNDITKGNAVGATGWTYLGHFVAGFENDYFAFKTGYKYAKLPPHANVSWTTVDQDWEAGYAAVGGYAQFATNNGFAEKTKEWMGAKLNLVVAPNRTADRAGNQYGLYTYATAEFGSHYVDIQYNGAYGSTFDTIEVYNDAFKTDLILGYKGTFGPVTAKVNALWNDYATFADDIAFADTVAANVQASYSDDYMDATVGYRLRGASTGMMYVEEGADDHDHVTDQLGDANTMKAWLNYTYKFAYGNAGIEPYMITTLAKDSALFFDDASQIEVGGKVFGGYDFDVVKFDAYANAKFLTGYQPEEGDAVEGVFTIGDIGLKVSTPLVLNGLAFVYGFDNDGEKAVYHTGIFELGLPAGINAQAGIGYRAAKVDENDKAYEDFNGEEFGFFVGANMKLNIPQKPVLYTQFVWNMDPYKGFGDGQDFINYDGYTIDSGVENYAGAGAFRVALRWDF